MTDFDDCFDGEPFPPDDPAETETQGPIDWVAKGRAEKVTRMVAIEAQRACDEGLDPVADSEQVARKLRGYTDEQWRDLQVAAGIGLGVPPHRRKVPSKATQEAVIDRFEQRATAAAHLDDA